MDYNYVNNVIYKIFMNYESYIYVNYEIYMDHVDFNRVNLANYEK